MSDLPKLYTVGQVSEALACSASNVYDLIAMGKLKAVKVGKSGGCFRIRHDDLEQFINESRT